MYVSWKDFCRQLNNLRINKINNVIMVLEFTVEDQSKQTTGLDSLSQKEMEVRCTYSFDVVGCLIIGLGFMWLNEI